LNLAEPVAFGKPAAPWRAAVIVVPRACAGTATTAVAITVAASAASGFMVLVNVI